MDQEDPIAQNHLNAARSKVNETFDRLQKALDQRCQQILSNLEHERNRMVREKEAQIAVLNERRMAVQSEIQNLEQVLDTASDSDLVTMLPDLKARLDSVKTTNMAAVEEEEMRLSTVTFDPQRLDTLEQELAGLGQVVEMTEEEMQANGSRETGAEGNSGE